MASASHSGRFGLRSAVSWVRVSNAQSDSDERYMQFWRLTIRHKTNGIATKRITPNNLAGRSLEVLVSRTQSRLPGRLLRALRRSGSGFVTKGHNLFDDFALNHLGVRGTRRPKCRGEAKTRAHPQRHTHTHAYNGNKTNYTQHPRWPVA